MAAPVDSEVTTFAVAAERYLAANRADWGANQDRDHRSRLKLYALPAIGSVPVAEVTVADMIKVLKPIWTGTGHGRGSKLRSLLERILNAADLPQPTVAAWSRLGGKLHKSAPATVPVASMPAADVPALIGRLVADNSMRAQALRVIILSATRLEETCGALWEEIDFDRKLWVIPKARMKMERDFEIPLSDALIKALGSHNGSGFVFPSRGGSISKSALHRLLNAYKLTCTVHGFRASFATWAQNQKREDGSLIYSPELIDACLAHQIGSKTSRAYQRALDVDARRPLMQAWWDHCTSTKP
jgi:integrase